MSKDHSAEANESMLQAAMGGMTPKEALLAASQAENENAEQRAADIARNRERALQLLAVLEKNLA